MSRALAPVTGIVVLVVATVVLAATVAGFAVSVTPTDGAVVSLSADPDGTVVLVLVAGGPLDVTDLSLSVRVAGRALARQPPVPFFAAHGFRSGPTGPFNSAADPRWTVGERASFRVAGTNAPVPDAGDRVEVTVRDGTGVVAVASAVVGEAGREQRALPAGVAGQSSLGTRPTETMAFGRLGSAWRTWWSTSSKPAVRNIRSASASS